MKYRILKDISLLTIAQAGPKNCDEFTGEYGLLVCMLQKIDFAGMRYVKDDDINSTHLMRWLEEKPKRIQWLIDKGFIEEIVEEIRCIWCKGSCTISANNRGDFWVSCDKSTTCAASGPVAKTHAGAVKLWNRRA